MHNDHRETEATHTTMLEDLLITTTTSQNYRATAYLMHNIIMMTGAAGFEEKQEETINKEQEFEEQWWIEEMNMGNTEQLKLAIAQGSAIAVSNGSFKEQTGAAAWTIEGATDKHNIIGIGV